MLHAVSFNVTIEMKKKKIKGGMTSAGSTVPFLPLPCLFLIEKVWFDMAAGDTDLCHSTN